MIAVAQDAQGEARVRPLVDAAGVSFPVLLDAASTLAQGLGFRIVPSGFFVDPEGEVVYRHTDDFDVADPRVQLSLERFLTGEAVESPEERAPMHPAALERFAEGAALQEAGRADDALAVWRQALALDPDNFVIRSQLWAAEQPERFWPAVDRDWQERRLAEEGYDKPLP